MIRSHDNQKLKTIRKLRTKRWRSELGLFAAEGEDLVTAAEAAGWEPVFVLRAGVDVEASLLEEASALGSGSRMIGVYEQRWVELAGRLSVYLHGVSDPGNVGTIIRSAHALADGPVILGPGCADPYSPKAVRASMGSIFARPPVRADFTALSRRVIALDGAAPITLQAALDRDIGRLLRDDSATAVQRVGDEAAEVGLPDGHAGGWLGDDSATAVQRVGDETAEVQREGDEAVVLCVGAEREGLPEDVLKQADVVASIPVNADGPNSLNVAMAASIGLYELANRMAAHG